MIGRKKEISELNAVCNMSDSSLVTIYGRRRIGKTYLVNHMFIEHRKECLFFDFTGTSDARLEVQLKNFIEQVYEWFRIEPKDSIKDWSDAFRFLKRSIDQKIEEINHKEKVIIFIDEIPWVDANNKDGFLDALGYFWNTYCEKRKNVLMILCGSNASWIQNKILEDANGPLHNRITKKMAMFPFDLKETKEFLIKEKGYDIGDKSATDIYMIFGGVAKYLSYLEAKKPLHKNIDILFFSMGGLMYGEYDKVFNSLFLNGSNFHKEIIDLLSEVNSGLTSSELMQKLEIKGGTKVRNTLNELEECGFVQSISKIGSTTRGNKYIISDPYILFHQKWIKPISKNEISRLPAGYWASQTSTQSYKIWRGFSFEIVLMTNIRLYIEKTGLSSAYESSGYWSIKAKEEEEKGAQIDLVVSYSNNQYDIIECKYYDEPFSISATYKKELQNKLIMFRKYGIKKRSSSAELRLVMVSTEGVKHNANFYELNIESITLEELLE